MEYVVRQTRYGYGVYQLIKLGVITALPYNRTLYKFKDQADEVAEKLNKN